MNYFTMHDADLFSFIRVPKELMTNPEYKDLSAESKLLYGVLLDRVSLSRKNNWVDDLGRIFIIYTRKDIMDIMGAGEKKITKLFNELREKKLIEEKRQGLQKPNLIYVGKFLGCAPVLDTETQPVFNTAMDSCDYLQNRQNDGSGHVKMKVLEPSKALLNNTNNNNTNISNTENLISQSDYNEMTDGRMDRLNEFETINHYFESQVFARTRYAQPDQRLIEDIKFNVLDMYFAPATMIAGDKKCQALVRAALMRLEPIHIDNIICKFHNITDIITNTKSYIQTMLYNESLETNLQINNQVKSDMANWKD